MSTDPNTTTGAGAGNNMDTINNVAAAASKTIFGDGSENKEPVSGRTGDVSKGEPYDAGNLDPEDQKKFESLPTPTPGTEPKKPFHVTDDPTAAATTSTEPTPKGDSSAGQTDPKSNPTDTTDHPEEETLGKQPEGPGPKPVAQLAQEHGGNAAAAAQDVKTEVKEDGEKVETKDDGKSKGTGEQVVHASGLQADGGDFDASKPGAGHEADRLMTEKGIAHGDQPGDKSGSGSGSGKKSLKDRIKAKFNK
ncbi:hypothetical protein LIA77_10164 [Sarocladium implicatum]|nr:hypothetical protein LIA77_10164 [Sarocladium implicatum]